MDAEAARFVGDAAAMGERERQDHSRGVELAQRMRARVQQTITRARLVELTEAARATYWSWLRDREDESMLVAEMMRQLEEFGWHVMM